MGRVTNHCPQVGRCRVWQIGIQHLHRRLIDADESYCQMLMRRQKVPRLEADLTENARLVHFLQIGRRKAHGRSERVDGPLVAFQGDKSV